MNHDPIKNNYYFKHYLIFIIKKTQLLLSDHLLTVDSGISLSGILINNQNQKRAAVCGKCNKLRGLLLFRDEGCQTIA
jgi:hypothetical protein